MRKILAILMLSVLLTSCVWSPPLEEPLRIETPTPSFHRPPDKPKVIWIVDKGVDRDWELIRQISEWNKAKYVDFRLTQSCPVASPCIIISEVRMKNAGEVVWATGETEMKIKLANDLPVAEKAATMCHELGHILGLPHPLNPESCMNDLGYIVKYPTASDIAVVDSYGQWSWYKASENTQ